MKRIFILLIISMALVNCNQEPKIKEELKIILEKSGNFTDEPYFNQPYIDIENSEIHKGKQAIHILAKYTLEDIGIELEIAQNDFDVSAGFLDISKADKIFVTYSSIRNIYLQSGWNEFDPNRKKVIIVLKN